MSRLTRIMTNLILSIGMMVLASAIQAQTTYYVDDDAPCDPGPGDPGVSSAFEDGSATYPFDAIQEGIDAAYHGLDTVLVKDGIYSGPGNRDLDFNSKVITLVSENGPYNTIIYLRREGRGFDLYVGAKNGLHIEGFFIGWGLSDYGGGIYIRDNSSPTIKNCIIHGNEASLNGGGIYCAAYSEPHILNCLITDNVAENGGGMYLAQYNIPELTGTEITGNYAFTDGGGIYCEDRSEFSHCTISENYAGQYGGGIYCYQAADVSHCTISHNHSEINGGGIFSESESAIFDHCTLVYNSAPGLGGGFCGDGGITNCTINNSIGEGVVIYGDGSSITDSEISDSDGVGVYFRYYASHMENCLIAGSGDSGIRCRDARPVIESCIITNNHSDDYGGGIHCQYGSDPEINHCTVTHNSSAQSGGGIHCWNDSHPLVTNSIFWDNDAPVGPEIYLMEEPGDPSTLIISYSDVEGGESAAVVETDCWLFWMWGMHADDPLFADPDGPDDDVLTWEDNDYHLSDGSPCIEAGDPFYAPKDGLTDIDGEPRKVAAYVDIGADEYIEDGAVFVCDIRCLTPVAYTGGEITFQTIVQNVTDQNQTAKYTYNIYLCNGDFLTEHRTVSPVAFSPYLTKTEESSANVPWDLPPALMNCDLRYELVVSRRISGKVLCTSSCYFQIQEGEVLQPKLEGK